MLWFISKKFSFKNGDYLHMESVVKIQEPIRLNSDDPSGLKNIKSLSFSEINNKKQLSAGIIAGVISFLVVIALVVLICFIIYWIPDQYNSDDLDTIRDTEIESRGQTFDLIAVAYKSLSCGFVKIFTKSRWSHVCLLYRNPKSNQLYIIECMRTHKCPDEIQIINFDHWMAHNKSFEKLYLPFQGLKKNTVDTTLAANASNFNYQRACRAMTQMASALFERKIKTNMRLTDWISTLKNIPYPINKEDQRWNMNDYSAFCTEFVILLLQQAGLVQKKWDPSCYSPVRIMYALHSDLVKSNLYAEKPLYVTSLPITKKIQEKI